MKNFPRIARLSTLGIVHHQNFNYEFNAFRTDFVGEGGAGKSMIADLLQLIFVGAAIFHSPTNSTGDRKPSTMVLKSEGRGTDIAYAFLNIEISKGIYLVVGIYLESSGHSSMFIIQEGTDFSEEANLNGFSQILGFEDFISDDKILPLDQLKDYILDTRSLVCESKMLNLYHRILFNNRILPIDLSNSKKTLENYAKIIQAFSREALDISKSAKLQDFLFGDQKEEEFKKDFERAVEELSGDVRQYEINSEEIDKLTRKQEALQDVLRSKDNKDRLLVNYKCAQYKDATKKYTALNCQVIETVARGCEAISNVELLELHATEMLLKITHDLEDIEEEHSQKYNAKIQCGQKSIKVSSYFSWLRHFNCSDEELFSLYQEFQNKKLTIQKVQQFSKALEESDILDFVSAVQIPVKKSLSGIIGIVTDLKKELELKNRLRAYKDLSNKNSLAHWAIGLGRKLSLEEESIVHKYHNENVQVSDPQNEDYRYMPQPDNILSKIANARKTEGGFWIDLDGIYEFCFYATERIFDNDNKEEIKLYFETQTLDLEKDIKSLEKNISGYNKLHDVLNSLESPDSFVVAWNSRQKIAVPIDQHEMYDTIQEEFQSLRSLFADANKIAEELKIAKLEYEDVDKRKVELATLQNNLYRETAKFVKIEISEEVLETITKYTPQIDDTDRPGEITKDFEGATDYFEMFTKKYRQEKSELQNLTTITEIEISISQISEVIKQLELTYPEIKTWTEQTDNDSVDDISDFEIKYNKANAEFLLRYNTVAREFLKETAKRLEDSGDFMGLCTAILPPDIFDHSEMLDEEIIDKINKYLRDINTKNQTLNGRKLQKLSYIIGMVDEEVSAQIHDIRTIKTFFNSEDKAITGGHHVFLDIVYESVFPKDWMRKFTDSINSDFSSSMEESLFTPSSMSSELERFPSLMEKMREAFYKCGGHKTLKPSITQLLNPKSYYDLKFSIKSMSGKKNDGSTSQTYAAIALLCMARLTLLDRNQPQGKIREGIRFMAIDEAEGLGSNFDMLFNIARANDYQILSLSINPNKVDAQNQNIYLLHNNPEYDDINYEPVPIFGLNQSIS